jgi:hypothetical protein
MPNNLYDLKTRLSQHGIMFCFNGPITQEMVTEIVTTLEQHLNQEKINRVTMARMFALVVEKAQNIMHYSAEQVFETDGQGNSRHAGQGIIAIGQEAGHYFVLSGNLVETSKIEKLRDHLRRLQQMSREEIKSYYREKRKHPPDQESKGAGLGFLEMARKASKPLEFEFTPVDETRVFFSVKTVI